MRTQVEGIVSAMGLAPDEAGGWSAPVARSAPGTSSAHTRLLGPGTRLRWRRATTDTVLFAHPGAVTQVHLRDAARGTALAVLGDDPAAGHLPQLALPARVSHTLSPAPGGLALWTETAARGNGWEFDDRPGPPALRPVLGDGPRQGAGADPDPDRPLRTGPAGRFPSGLTRVLTRRVPVRPLHRSAADVTYLLHAGGPFQLVALSPEGTLHEYLLGRDPGAGQIMAVTVPGGWWRAAGLPAGTPAATTGEAHFGPTAMPGPAESPTDVLRRFPRLAGRLLPYSAR
ncbi:cupin domain-containing protein [Streptomyces sp. HD1123-B1]|uniref:cupin domain-containing protein n=1 Tax=Streptomyces huangiella TaxID=3228804 RepID=UPI003D7DF78F